MIPDFFLGLPVHNISLLDWSPVGDLTKVLTFGQIGGDIRLSGSVARDAVRYDTGLIDAVGRHEACFDGMSTIVEYQCTGGRWWRYWLRPSGGHCKRGCRVQTGVWWSTGGDKQLSRCLTRFGVFSANLSKRAWQARVPNKALYLYPTYCKYLHVPTAPLSTNWYCLHSLINSLPGIVAFRCLFT